MNRREHSAAARIRYKEISSSPDFTLIGFSQQGSVRPLGRSWRFSGSDVTVARASREHFDFAAFIEGFASGATRILLVTP